MSSDNISSNYMGAFIGSLVGGLMILLFDFAGWEDSNYYLGIYSEGWIDLTSGSIAFIIIGSIGVGLLYVAFNSYNATKEPPSSQMVDKMYKISLAALIGILIGAIIFAIAISDTAEWWFGEGFYGGVIGSLISTLLLRNAKNAK